MARADARRRSRGRRRAGDLAVVRSRARGASRSARATRRPSSPAAASFVHSRRDPEELVTAVDSADRARCCGSRSIRRRSPRISTPCAWRKGRTRRRSSSATASSRSASPACSRRGDVSRRHAARGARTIRRRSTPRSCSAARRCRRCSKAAPSIVQVGQRRARRPRHGDRSGDRQRALDLEGAGPRLRVADRHYRGRRPADRHAHQSARSSASTPRRGRRSGRSHFPTSGTRTSSRRCGPARI